VSASLQLTGGTVIDGTGQRPREATIVVEDGRIVTVGSGDGTPRSSGDAQTLDVRGKFVIPGLMDANVHLILDTTAEVLLLHRDRYADLAIEAAQLALRGGVTTLFDTWGPPGVLAQVRDSINSGKVTGSRVYLAGNIIGLDGPLTDDFNPPGTVLSRKTIEVINAEWECGVGGNLQWQTAETVGDRVCQYIAETGVDFVKYAASGHGSPRCLLFSEAAQRAIVEEAHRAGLTAQAHTSTPESLRMEITAGADLLQHPDITGIVPLPADTFATIVERRLPCAAIMTTKAHHEWLRRTADEPWATVLRVQDANNDRLVAAGARMLLTTDAGVVAPTSYSHPQFKSVHGEVVDSHLELGSSHVNWLRSAIERGMDPMTALQSATRYIAEAYQVADEVGTLEAEKRADILVLDSDPLADPLNYARIRYVIKDGTIVDRDRLPERPVLTSASAFGA